MPQSESKQIEDDAAAGSSTEPASTPATVEDASTDEEPPAHASTNAAGGEASASKKKKSKKKKLKSAIGLSGGESSRSAPSAAGLSEKQLQTLLDANPALKAEFMNGSAGDKKKMADMVRSMDINEMLTGLSLGRGSKDVKDMGSYRFWQTQPVPSFEEGKKPVEEDGPLKVIDPERVPKEPKPLPAGYEWVTMDLTDDKELEEVWDLLANHYVEDDEAMFRFNYSGALLNWALKAPGWRKEWHVGVRAAQSRKLVAFISGIPFQLRVRKNVLQTSEINFMCVHKKLRSKRLAPELIKEITRRCYQVGIYQAIYTGGVILPTPVSTCRYFHRSLDWEKLHDVGFSPLPPTSTRARQISKYKLPTSTATHGLRPMVPEDIDQVTDLLTRYLDRVDLAQQFTKEEALHWLLQNGGNHGADQVVWSYVVEDPTSKKITDFFSFYCLESTVIGNTKHKVVRAAYLFYYATDTAFSDDNMALKIRLNVLIKDALILAKKANFDVFNALTLLDNPLFLDDQKFGAGDGHLHYYLYNYRTASIKGGVDPSNDKPDDKYMGGIGVVML